MWVLGMRLRKLSGYGNETEETVWLLEENCLAIGGKLSGYVGSGNETRENCLVMWVLGTRLRKLSGYGNETEETVWLWEQRLGKTVWLCGFWERD